MFLVLLNLYSKINYEVKELFIFIGEKSFVSYGTSSVIVNIQRPNDISVPQSVQKVVVVNLEYCRKNMVGNIVEGYLQEKELIND